MDLSHCDTALAAMQLNANRRRNNIADEAGWCVLELFCKCR